MRVGVIVGEDQERLVAHPRASLLRPTECFRVDRALCVREVLDHEQVGLGDEVFDILLLQVSAGVQSDPVLLVHVVSGRDVLVLLAERFAVLGVRLEDHHWLTSNVSE